MYEPFIHIKKIENAKAEIKIDFGENPIRSHSKGADIFKSTPTQYFAGKGNFYLFSIQ
jgi:hypothetical protein